jgi:hypothetical protein
VNPICRAIHEHRLLAFDYHGHHRIVACYCHGTSTSGAEVLRAIQVGGASGSGGFGFGKLWLVADVRSPNLLEASFEPDDPQYNPNDSAMRAIHCRI